MSFPHSDDNALELSARPKNVDSSHPRTGFSITTPQKGIMQKKQRVKLWDRIVNLFSDWWMGEVLAILVSIFSFIAIVMVLREYNNRALPKLPYNVSINFVVSTLATVSKSSLLLAVASAIGQFKWLWMSANYRSLRDLQTFDEASRGPLGASKLLISRTRLSWASVGAIITLLCLIYDPFIQGLISTQERSIYKDDPASLLNIIVDYPDAANGNGDIIYNYQLMDAIDDAIATPKILSETQPRCPTGNCTWPLFTSLGFCCDCQNVTSYMQSNSNSTYYHPPGCNETIKYRNWTYTLPNVDGQALTLLSGERFFNASLMTSGLQTLFYGFQPAWTTMTAFNYTNGASIPTISLTILMQVSPQASDIGAISSAYVCGLSFCAQRRDVSVSLNQLSSTILHTVYGVKSDSPNGTSLSFTGDNINMTYPSNLTGPSAAADWVSWALQFEFFFSNFTTMFSGLVSGDLNWTSGQRIAFSSSSSLSGLNESPDIPMAMNNFATAITNYYSDSSNTTVVGQSGQSEVFIRITWCWLTLPTLLIAAGTVFLILAVLETKRAGVHVWKTSELALLFHGLGCLEQEFTMSDRESEMERMAEVIIVRIENAGGRGWTLLRQEKASRKAV